MTDSRLEYLFQLILNIAEAKRKSDNKFDGKAFWQPIKNNLSDKTIESIKFRNLSKKLVDSIMKLQEKYIDGYGNEVMIASNHFLIQQVRIPTTEPISLRKIIQIALNIGQWKGSPNYEIYENIKYDNTGLDKINTYITKADIKIISAHIDEDKIQKIEDYIKSLSFESS
jgi:hypothetical protein